MIALLWWLVLFWATSTPLLNHFVKPMYIFFSTSYLLHTQYWHNTQISMMQIKWSCNDRHDDQQESGNGNLASATCRLIDWLIESYSSIEQQLLCLSVCTFTITFKSIPPEKPEWIKLVNIDKNFKIRNFTTVCILSLLRRIILFIAFTQGNFF